MSEGIIMCQVVILASASRPKPSTLLQISSNMVEESEGEGFARVGDKGKGREQTQGDTEDLWHSPKILQIQLDF